MISCGVTAEGRGVIMAPVQWRSETESYEPKVGGKNVELMEISTVVFCTGYRPNLDCLSEELREAWAPNQTKLVWSVPDHWKMEENSMTADIGDVAPSKKLHGGEYYVKRGLYRHLLISNPSMMFLYEATSYPLLEIDIAAWLCLAYICGDVAIPSKAEMNRQNHQQQLDEMSIPYLRYYKDSHYYAALNQKLSKDHWWYKYTSEEYQNYSKEYTRYQIKILARNMVLSKYPGGFGTYQQLSERGEQMVEMTNADSQARYQLKSGEADR